MMTEKRSAEKTTRDICRRTRKKYSAEEKMRIVLEGLRGEESIAELCRREASTSMFTIAGQRNSWRPARSVWPATPCEKPPQMKWLISRKKTPTSSKRWLNCIWAMTGLKKV